MYIENKKYFSEHLALKLMDAEDERKISYLDFDSGSVLKEENQNMNNLELIHKGVEEYCRNNNSFNLEWYKDKSNGIRGNIKLNLTIENLFEDDLSSFYDNEMIKENKDIQFFRPFDYSTPESQCGFVIKPDIIYPSIYYNQAGRSSLHSLDLDFKGYTEMALEARVFFHWQVVLLHYNGRELGKEETDFFKKEMPIIFPDFIWDKFIEKYESVRLSKK